MSQAVRLPSPDPTEGQQPLVTVVIPTRDRWSLLETSLKTALAQEEVTVEVIVVDDGSVSPIPEGSPPWDDARVRCLRHPAHLGVAAARNAGIAAARGRWVAFLDDDDLWSPRKLCAQIEAAEKVDAAFSYAGAALIHDGGAYLQAAPAPPPERLRSMLRSYNAIPAGASNVVVDTALVRSLGGFDLKLRHLADWDLWIRLANEAAAASCPDLLVGYRIHPSSMRVVDGGALGELRYLDAKHHRGLPSAADRISVYRWLAMGQFLGGRRLAAALTYALGLARYPSAENLVTAGRTLVTAMWPRESHSNGRSRRSGRREGARIPWLERRLADPDAPQTARPSPSPRASGRRRFAAGAKARLNGAHIITRVLELTSLKAGVAIVYHEIGDSVQRPTASEVVPVVHESVFPQHVDHLRTRYELVAAEQFIEKAMARRRGQRFPIALTFDDDLRSHHAVAAPVLASRGVKATFFLTGASLHGPASFWWERLQRAIDAEMSVDVDGSGDDSDTSRPGTKTATELASAVAELPPEARDAFSENLRERLGDDPPRSGLRGRHVRELVEDGFEIGFHTRRHRTLLALSDADLLDELREGREELERAAGRAISLIAYPHGAADARVAEAAKAAGYKAGFTTTGNVVSERTSPLLIGRLDPSRASLGHFAMQLALALLRERVRRARPGATAPSRA